jgi:hypothetical protein
MHHSGYVFGVVDVVTAFFARAKLRGSLFDIGVELGGVVEGGYHDVSALSPIMVIAVVQNDPAVDAVIIRIHLGHGGSIRAASDPDLVRRCWARIEQAFWTARVLCLSRITVSTGRRQSPTMTMPKPTTIDSERYANRKLTNPLFAGEASWSAATVGASLRPAPHAAASSAANQFA